MKNTEPYNIDLAALHITYSCTHKCPMCYAHGARASVAHPSLENLCMIIDELAKARIPEISLVGGDPASYPNIGELVRYISGKGIRISILSNTLEFENTPAENMAKYVTAFEGTIHSNDPQEHDSFCGCEGAFVKLVENLKTFQRLGKEVGIALNITPSTADNLYNIVKDLLEVHELNVNYIVLQRIVPFGRAQGASEFSLTKEEVTKAMGCVEKIDKDFNVDIMVEDPFPLCILDEKYWRYIGHRCAWGWRKIAINPNGDLSRCGADPRFMLGNLFETPILDIWNNSEILKLFRECHHLPEKCHSCEHLQLCGGGCSLSCKDDKAHSVDYLLGECQNLHDETIGDLLFRRAGNEHISSIAKIELANFSKYQHVLDAQSIKEWYDYNSDMFYVVTDENNDVFAYAIIVPMTALLYEFVRTGKYSTLVHFPKKEVLTNLQSNYFHLEIIATIPAKKRMPVSGILINGVGEILLDHAKVVTTCPMTEKGAKLSNFFGFTKIAEENCNGEIYPIAELKITSEAKEKFEKFRISEA